MICIFLFQHAGYRAFLDFTTAMRANSNLDAARESCSSLAAAPGGQRSHLFLFDFTPIVA